VDATRDGWRISEKSRARNALPGQEIALLRKEIPQKSGIVLDRVYRPSSSSTSAPWWAWSSSGAVWRWPRSRATRSSWDRGAASWSCAPDPEAGALASKRGSYGKSAGCQSVQKCASALRTDARIIWMPATSRRCSDWTGWAPRPLKKQSHQPSAEAICEKTRNPSAFLGFHGVPTVLHHSRQRGISSEKEHTAKTG
jgi:hypothetical protein